MSKLISTTNNPDLQARLKTAAILILVFILVVLMAVYSELGRKIFAILVFVLIAAAGFELGKFPLEQAAASKFYRSALMCFPAFLVLVCTLFCPVISAELFFGIILGAVTFVQALNLSLLAMRTPETKETENMLLNFGLDQIGFVLLGLGGASAVALAFLSPLVALGLVAQVAIADSVSYFAGRTYGKRKIAPLVSPNKTVIGTISGILAGGLFGLIIVAFSSTQCPLSWATAFLFSVATIICAQSGDYAKSIVKRNFGIKDFGQIFPGHGGVLDRLDGILGAAPFVFVFVSLLCKH